MTGTPLSFWFGFHVLIFFMLALDLGIFHRKTHEVGLKEAAIWSVVWVGLSLFFNLFVWHQFGKQRALEFLTGYIIEKSLSVDNVFVFVVIFNFFVVPASYHHRVLFWGILGALMMRGAFIAAGTALISRFHWILYVFGAFLIYTAIKLAFSKDEGVHPERNPVVIHFRRWFPVTANYVEAHLFVRQDGRWMATPLFLVLLVVETTDLIFALDSIPAVFAITREPFIVYTSNVCAILGLRALYFLLAGVMGMFRYLKPGLAIILGFVGLKMCLEKWIDISIGHSLGVVAAVLFGAVALSILAERRERGRPSADLPSLGPEIETSKHREPLA
ncbi:MAG: TerC family protein [Planctomycetes bacterium]|nr:TerC family protein [Planctomycetota bacterium]